MLQAFQSSARAMSHRPMLTGDYFTLCMADGKAWCGPVSTVPAIDPKVILAARLFTTEPRADALRRVVLWSSTLAQ